MHGRGVIIWGLHQQCTPCLPDDGRAVPSLGEQSDVIRLTLVYRLVGWAREEKEATDMVPGLMVVAGQASLSSGRRSPAPGPYGQLASQNRAMNTQHGTRHCQHPAARRAPTTPKILQLCFCEWGWRVRCVMVSLERAVAKQSERDVPCALD